MAGLVVAIGFAGLVAGDGTAGVAETVGGRVLDRSAWRATAWPFLRDQWGDGIALSCPASRCGAETQLYLRTKVGFCDCFNHVEDDDDIDRLTDFDLIGGAQVMPLGPGRRRSLAAGPARLRSFRLEGSRGEVRHAVAVVLAVDCQARVAMLVSERSATPTLEAAVLTLLDDPRSLRKPSIPAADRSDATQ
jgi:hypothetical protein